MNNTQVQSNGHKTLPVNVIEMQKQFDAIKLALREAKANMPATATIGEYKGQPVITLASQGSLPFTFGARKAKLIVELFDAIKKFSDGIPNAK